MKSDESHAATAEALFKAGTKSQLVREALMKEGLSNSQSCSVIRSARKRLGIYKPIGQSGASE
jgi:hypothetical protein